MPNLAKRKAKFFAVLATLGAVSANAAVTMPTADYSNIEAAAAIGFGIVLTVGLLKKAKSFFR